MRLARAGPTRGKASSSCAVAAFTSIGNGEGRVPVRAGVPRGARGLPTDACPPALVSPGRASPAPRLRDFAFLDRLARGLRRAESTAARWAARARAAPAACTAGASPRVVRSKRCTPTARAPAPMSASATRNPRIRRSPSVAMGPLYWQVGKRVSSKRRRRHHANAAPVSADPRRRSAVAGPR